MMYENKIKEIINVAKSHKLVAQVTEGDVYEKWNSGENKYPAINISPTSIDVNLGCPKIRMVITYADRLRADEENKLQIQGQATSTIQQILNRLQNEYGYVVDFEYSIQLYTQKFADLLCGGYVEIGVIYSGDEDFCDNNDYFNY